MKFAALSLLVAVASAKQTVLYPIQDATILAGQDHASESSRNQVGTTLEGARRALVQFDMSDLPQSAVISKVSLKVSPTQKAAGRTHNEVHLYRLLSPWTESHSSSSSSDDEGTTTTTEEEDVTWKYSTYSTVPWRKEGGDFDKTILASSTGSTFQSTANLKTLVQKMVRGDLPNFGFILKGDELVVEPSYFEFSSLEGPQDALPQLIVDYDVVSSSSSSSKKPTKKKTASSTTNQKLRGLQSGDGDGGDGDGGDGDGGDGDGGDGDGGDGDGGDGDGGDGDGGDGNGGDGDGGDGDGGDGDGGDGDGGDGDGGDGDGGATDGDGGDGVGGDTEGGDGDGGDGDGGDGEGGDDDVFLGGLCFSGSSSVEVENVVGPVLMKDLKIGDSVKVAPDQYERVYSFGHYNPNSTGKFLVLNHKLEVSAPHMIATEAGFFVPASSLKVGDSIITGSSTVETITSISTKTAKGMYAPFTPSGTIIVSDVLASTFVTMQDETANLEVGGVNTGISWHWIAQSFEAPHRFACSHYLDFDKWCANERYTTVGGISMWVHGPFHATKAVLDTHPVIATMLLTPAVVVLATMWSVEQVASMGGGGVLTTVLMATALLFALKKKEKKC